MKFNISRMFKQYKNETLIILVGGVILGVYLYVKQILPSSWFSWITKEGGK